MITLSPSQYRALPKRKTSKYRNKPVYLVGAVVVSDKEHAKAIAKGRKTKIVRFASQSEYRRDCELHDLQRSNVVGDIKRQPRFPLIVGGVKICTYVGDWEYMDFENISGPIRVVEDRKGALTPAFKIKWALAKALFPEIEWRLS